MTREDGVGDHGTVTGPTGPARVVRPLVTGLLLVVALVAVLAALGALGGDPARTPGVMSDALGPEPGEPVAGYLERARASLETDGGTAPDRPRWALVTAVHPWSVPDAADVTAPAPRVSVVYVQTPRDDAAMPVFDQVLAEPVGGADRSTTFAAAIARLVAPARQAPDAYSHETADALAGGEPAVVAALVHADTAALRRIAATPGVRAVEALPQDAVAGRFAVRPLLPQQTVRADPLPGAAAPRTN